jgi:serine/threonine protein kinase
MQLVEPLLHSSAHSPVALSALPLNPQHTPTPLKGTVVAVKRLLTDDASTIERFVSEVRLLARLRHPNLILFMGESWVKR